MDSNIKHLHKTLKICVSGAAETGHCGIDALEKAKELGREIAKNKSILIIGASSGFSLWVAMGAKEEGGMVIGFSPAASEHEHVDVYKLPIDYMDLIIYTGFGYGGRDTLMIRSSDAVICGCGRIGTIHNFTGAFEDGKVIGIFDGPWETGKELKDILEKGHRENPNIVINDNPKILLEKLIPLIKKQKVEEFKL